MYSSILPVLPILIVVIITLLIMVVMFAKNYNLYEGYANKPSLYITDNDMNIDAGSYRIDNTLFADAIDDIKKTNKLGKELLGSAGFAGFSDFADSMGVKDGNVSLIIDPYINSYVLQNDYNTEDYKDGIFVCLTPIKIGAEKCIWDFSNKVVGYIYMSDYLFIQAMIKGYRQSVTDNNIMLRRIRLDDLKNIDKQFDYLFTYVVLNSKYMEYIKYSKYYISGLNDVDIYRIKAFYPFITENYNNVRQYFNKQDDDKTYDIYLSTQNSLIPTMKYTILRDIVSVREIREIREIRGIENFITRLDMPEDYLEGVEKEYDTKLNNKGKYGCYGNSKITSKFECDSLYTYDGNIKNYYSTWDKKCSIDSECPYYKSNKKYPNERGGCINGNCEFPVGVKRLGFKKYSDEKLNSPLCYECSNTTDYNCCSKLSDIKDGSNTNSDYVFENDFNDRKKYNLNTIISLLDYRGL
jgi:hypothetical protein